MTLERSPVPQSGLLAEELQPVGAEQLDQPGQEKTAEQLSQDAHREQECRTRRDPSLAVERDAAARHDHVDVRVVGQRRAPAVQHGGDADARAEMARVGSDGQHGLRGRTEQQVVDNSLVLGGDGGDLGREAEHDVEVADRQEIGLAGGQPVASGGGLALGTMPVATAVVGDPTVATVLAALDVAAQGGGATALDRRHDLELLQAQMAGMGGPVSGSVSAQDVGDLERGALGMHEGQPLGLAPTLSPGSMRAMILSSGLMTVRTTLVATRV